MSLCIFCASCFTTIYGPGADAQQDVTPWASGDAVPWVVSPAEASSLVLSGATLWDVRNESQRAAQPIAGARVVTWQQFSQPSEPDRGKLLVDDAKLAAQLQVAGARAKAPVVVIGDPVNGWGEDGRLVWMLRSVGHPSSAFVDGGAEALGRVWSDALAEAAYQGPGDVAVVRTQTWDVDAQSIKARIEDDTVTLLDTRERREYDGETPYGEQRGGHVPGAKHLYFKALIDDSGKLLPRKVLLDKLSDLGLEQDRPVIAYCTGGVRSGWFVAVLVWLGFEDVSNYAGSMWEWSSLPESEYPLTLPQ